MGGKLGPGPESTMTCARFPYTVAIGPGGVPVTVGTDTVGCCAWAVRLSTETNSKTNPETIGHENSNILTFKYISLLITRAIIIYPGVLKTARHPFMLILAHESILPKSLANWGLCLAADQLLNRSNLWINVSITASCPRTTWRIL
jgi:hypothetical protein